MQYINNANGKLITDKTAKEIAYLFVEGVAVRASGAEWRRINKRIRQMGLTWGNPTEIGLIDLWGVNIVIQEAEDYFASDVDVFLEEMYIMGMLEEADDDDDDD
jgi:hypothetical protein